MPTIDEQLAALDYWRSRLARALNTLGVEASEDETLNTLIPKVFDIYGITFFGRVSDSFDQIGIEASGCTVDQFSDGIKAQIMDESAANIESEFGLIPIETSSCSIIGITENIETSLTEE